MSRARALQQILFEQLKRFFFAFRVDFHVPVRQIPDKAANSVMLRGLACEVSIADALDIATYAVMLRPDHGQILTVNLKF